MEMYGIVFVLIEMYGMCVCPSRKHWYTIRMVCSVCPSR